MGRAGRSDRRRIRWGLACAAAALAAPVTMALAAGPGGWDHLGDRGTPGTDSLDLVASALTTAQGVLYVGGEFTDAGGVANADRIATWNGSSWSAVSSNASQIANGRVSAIAVSGGKVYAGGTFQNAGGNADADFLAVWDGTSWAPFCGTPPAFTGNVTSLQVVNQTLFVGGEFQNASGIASADYLVACDLGSGNASTTVLPAANPFAGPVYALAADNNNTLYAGGGFTNLQDIAAADNVAALPAGGVWQSLGAGGGACGCAVTTFVRGLAAVGTDAYIGTDAVDVAGIPQADHVAKWNGTAWSALGANTGGGDGWFPAIASINALTGFGSNLFATGSFQNANGEARADNVAFFDGTSWNPVGSDGAGDGPWSGTGLALAINDSKLYATGSFTSAGGDPQARFAASFALSQVIAVPTPTVTQGPSPAPVPTPTVTEAPPMPTPTVTQGPNPPPDDTAPPTSLRRAKVDQAAARATFAFGSGEAGAAFACSLDGKAYKPCVSPKTYRSLKPGKHVFRVRARDEAGNVDRTPVVRRFAIAKRRD